MLHLLGIMLVLGVQPGPSAQPDVPKAIVGEPGADSGFANAVVAINRTDGPSGALGRSAGVFVDPRTLVVPLRMAIADDLDVVTFDCAPVEIEGVVGVDEQAGLALVRITRPLPNGRVLVPANEPVDAGDDVTVGLVAPIVECGFMTARSRPVAVLSRRQWATRGELLHVRLWNSLAGLASPLLTEDGLLQGVIVAWGGAETSLAVPVDRIEAIARHAPITLADFDIDDLSPGARARILAKRASVRREQGDIEGAMALAEQALQDAPDCWRALWEAGVCADKRGDKARAEELLRQAVEIEPGFSEAWNSLGLVLLAGGDGHGAIGPFQRAIEIDGRSAGALGMLAVAHMQTGDMEKAITLGERSIAADGVEPNLFSNLILMHDRLGHTEDAMRVCRKWTEAFPDDSAAWACYASKLLDAEKWEECLAACERAVELNPKDAHSGLNLAMSALMLGDRERARKAVQAILQRQPDHPMARSILEFIDSGGG